MRDDARSRPRRRKSTVQTSRRSVGDFDPYSEGLIDRIVAEWSSVVPGQNPEARTIAATVYRIAALLRRETDLVLSQHRLSDTEFHLLGGLRRAGAPYCRSPSELSPRYVPVTSGGLTGVITRLQRRGLVRRRKDPLDGRGVLVELTPAGTRLIETVMAAVAERESLLSINLTLAERRKAVHLLRNLLRTANARSGL